MNITGSIVLYNTPEYEVLKVVQSFFSSKLSDELMIIDNSEIKRMYSWFDKYKIRYIENSNNGYGAGHNIAIQEYVNRSKYHLIMNTDIEFTEDTLGSLFEYLEQDQSIGLAMPKVFNEAGEMQYLCKLLPTPYDWFFRRFFPILGNNKRFELRFADYNEIIDAPYLSGCFMFLRNSIILTTGGFDERFFLHCEDTDLSRRINEVSRTIYFPKSSITHIHKKESHKNLKMLKIHIQSTIKYFNKWGWFFDIKRYKTNKKTIFQINNISNSKK